MRILHVINSLQPAGAERHLANLLGPLAPLLAMLVALGDHLGQALIRETLRATGESE